MPSSWRTAGKLPVWTLRSGGGASEGLSGSDGRPAGRLPGGPPPFGSGGPARSMFVPLGAPANHAETGDPPPSAAKSGGDGGATNAVNTDNHVAQSNVTGCKNIIK